MSGIRIREEREGDRAAVREVNRRAFPSPAEADLVDALRGRTTPRISLVAEDDDGGVHGHILFTPVAIDGLPPEACTLGLAPMAVRPGLQRQGVGSALVAAGLDACRAAGASLVVVLGHVDYYPRFGFRPAWEHGLYFAKPGPNPAFMVFAFEPDALDAAMGEVRYHPAFEDP